MLTGDFTETDNCAGQTLAPGSSCSVQIVFAPTATGARSGQLTIYANIAGGQATVSLNGTGTAAAAIVLTPLTLSFPATIVNQTAASQDITVSNTGGTLATLSAPVAQRQRRRLCRIRQHLRNNPRARHRLHALDHLHPHGQRCALGHAFHNR